MKSKIFCLLTIFTELTVQAQPVVLPPGATTINPDALAKTTLIVAWEKFHSQGIMTEADLNNKAFKDLQKKTEGKPGEPPYDFQRVEIPGFGSADDSTEREFPSRFDKQVPISHLNQYLSKPTNLIDKAWRVRDDIKSLQADHQDLKQARKGELSDRAKNVLKDLEGKEINQLVCHSMGTEITYNAIFEGVIRPPRELFVLAPPDNNLERWRVLAEKTGTIVHIYEGKTDLVIKAANLKAVQAVIGAVEIPSDHAELEKLWDNSKHSKDYNLHCRNGKCDDHPDVPTPGLTGHGRIGHYALLVQNNGPFSQTVQDMKAAQDIVVKKEADRIFKEVESKVQADLNGQAEQLHADGTHNFMAAWQEKAEPLNQTIKTQVAWLEVKQREEAARRAEETRRAEAIQRHEAALIAEARRQEAELQADIAQEKKEKQAAADRAAQIRQATQKWAHDACVVVYARAGNNIGVKDISDAGWTFVASEEALAQMGVTTEDLSIFLRDNSFGIENRDESIAPGFGKCETQFIKVAIYVFNAHLGFDGIKQELAEMSQEKQAQMAAAKRQLDYAQPQQSQSALLSQAAQKGFFSKLGHAISVPFVATGKGLKSFGQGLKEFVEYLDTHSNTGTDSGPGSRDHDGGERGNSGNGHLGGAYGQAGNINSGSGSFDTH